jgi:HlyD family secretion protein
MTWWKSKVLWLSGGMTCCAAVTAAIVVGGGFVDWAHLLQRPGTSGAVASAAEREERDDTAVRVRTIRPKPNDRELERTVSQPAYVQGFFKSDLMARVPGPVKAIEKNIGDLIQQGEVLVELDVPDLLADLEEKDAQVKLAEQNARAAEANIAIVEAGVKEAETQIHEKEADVDRAEAKRKYHESEYHRYQLLAGRKSVLDSVVEAEQRDYEASQADVKSAKVAVDAARAKHEGFTAKLQAARVDVDVKKALVTAAKAGKARAQTMVDFARIHAPYNGMIVARYVDPGAFVQNASTGHPTPVLSVVRTDVVTLVTWVPEKDAPYVTKNTEAIVHMDALGSDVLHGKVTRLSHALDPDKSRDMRVEVDVPNPKGVLEPGMYGTMRLLLQKFDKAHLVPTSAVFERGGRTCIFEVRDGKAVLVPVLVQLEDGVEAKIVKLVRRANPQTGKEEEAAEELTGQEEIIRSGQGEIANGQMVHASEGAW